MKYLKKLIVKRRIDKQAERYTRALGDHLIYNYKERKSDYDFSKRCTYLRHMIECCERARNRINKL